MKTTLANIGYLLAFFFGGSLVVAFFMAIGFAILALAGGIALYLLIW